MCICCCNTRKSIIIYTIVITCFAIFYGIIVMINFGSRTKIYKALIDKLDYLENQNNDVYLSRRLTGDSHTNSRSGTYYYGSTYYNNELTEEILNSLSFQLIQ